jgi:hydrogenase expression/formation protein HypC
VTRRRPPGQPSEASSAAAGECHGDHCITCSDTAVEVRVLRLLADNLAVVEAGASEETVSVALVTARVGDTILVHASEAIAVIGT